MGVEMKYCTGRDCEIQVGCVWLDLRKATDSTRAVKFRVGQQKKTLQYFIFNLNHLYRIT